MNNDKTQFTDISIIMGSQSDWQTMKHACLLLEQFHISYEKRIISAHRTPERLYEFARTACSRKVKVIIAGAGGAAHLPGMVASLTPIPVLGVPIESKLAGQDSLYSIVQMPAGIPVACFAIGQAGATNAALHAVSILALHQTSIAKKLLAFRQEQTESIALHPNDNP